MSRNTGFNSSSVVITLLLAGAMASPSGAIAQSSTALPPSNAQSAPAALHASATGGPAVTAAAAAVVDRARTLADNGDGDKARALLDSLVAAAPAASVDMAEGLFWRASLGEQSSSAERDLKRLILDVPMSARAPEALVRLSELDMLRNNLSLARQHAQRAVWDYPDSPVRTRALLVLAKSYFGDNDAPRACGVLTTLRHEAPLSAVEIRLQADELQQGCRGIREIALGAEGVATADRPAATPPGATAATATATLPTAPNSQGMNGGLAGDRMKSDAADSRAPRNVAAKTELPKPDVATSESSKPEAPNSKTARSDKTPNSTGRFTVQVAAYDTRAQADALVKRLTAKKIVAHTAGTRKPFRVQVGRYATRAEATTALAAMKKKGQKGFVAEVGTP